MVRRRLFRRAIIVVIFTLILYVILAFVAKVKNLREALLTFNLIYLFPPIILAIGNYFLRYLRWKLFLRSSKITIAQQNSFFIFISGFLGTLTPGKIGESIKSLLLRDLYDIPLSKSLPIVFLERFNDLICCFILIFMGISFFEYGRRVTILTGSITFLLLVVLLIRPFQLYVLRFILRFKPIRKSGLHIYSTLKEVLTPRITLISTAYGTLAWALEGIGFWFILYGFGIGEKIAFTIFLYAFASVVGALSMLPGGIGLTEGGLVGGLIAAEIPQATAIASTILIRLTTLWFAVFLGIIASLVLLKTQR